MFVQLESMTEKDYPSFKVGVIKWINTNQSHTIQFAVMDCAVGVGNEQTRAINVSLYFNGTENQADRVTKIKISLTQDIWRDTDKVEGCIRTTVKRSWWQPKETDQKHQTFFSVSVVHCLCLL